MTRRERIEEQLRAALAPNEMEVQDQSHLHVGHVGARDGRGHFSVFIVADAFTGKPLIERHRLVHDALEDMLKTDIHALSIKAKAPGEMKAG